MLGEDGVSQPLSANRYNSFDLDLRGALGENRTPNLLIRSQMLYPLSYERRWT